MKDLCIFNENAKKSFVILLFVGFSSLLLLKNETSSYTNSDAATHEDKLFAFIHKLFDCLLFFLSCYEFVRHFAKLPYLGI